MNHTRCYTKDYPRPQFVRGEWVNLNGKWDFAFDDENNGEKNGYSNGFKKQYDIIVPFSYESEASGIGKKEMVRNVWYSRTFSLSAEQLKKRVVLNFESVDYTAKVWLNGLFVGAHSGGYTRFSFDITNVVKRGDNLLVVKAEDGFDLTQPRGKQRWKNYNYGCWYEQTTGIWKTVWLEFTDSRAWIDSVKITPRFDNYAFDFEFECSFEGENYELETSIFFRGQQIKKINARLDSEVLKTSIMLESPKFDNQVYFWSPNDPFVYDMEFILRKDGEIIDYVGSYCGLREFKAVGATMQLNKYPFYQKLVLYQGYWEKTLLTIPNEEAMIRDIEMVKELGFNGIRIHQKNEDERFLYYCDIMGLLVWCEMPSPHSFSDRATSRFMSEWMEIIRQNYNHTSIITWVIFNESWGVREIGYNKAQQLFCDAMYHITKAHDGIRPVISNDGWEHTLSDVLTIHNYEQNANLLGKYYSDLNDVLYNRKTTLPQRAPYANNYSYGGQPVIFSEYGGMAFASDIKDDCWGYGQAVNDLGGFYERFEKLLNTIKALPYCAGYCYTQFTDVQQEKNGLLTLDRKFKVDPKVIKEINERNV